MFGGYQTPLRYKALKEIRDVSLYKIGDKQVSLHECALLGQYENLQAILTNQSCALDQRDHRGINALHYSARGGHMNCFKLLLQQSNQDMLLSETRRSYCNILHSAALGGNAQLVKYIMEKFQQAYSSEMLERFVTMENIYGKLPAHCAAQSGDIPTFRLLTEGFNINIQAVAKDGRMFHHLAAERGFLQMVEYLYAKLSTADFRTVTKEGHDILYFSARSGNLKLVEFTVNKLVTEKDKTLCNENILKWTPLFAASLSFHPEVVEYLLKIDNTLSVNSVSAANLQSPLSCAAGSGCLEMVKTLIKHGANPRISCTKPILHFAAEGGNIELMDYLMNECGLTDQLFEEPKILGSCPQNIFHHAVASGDDQMVRFLLQKKQIYPQLEGLLYCTGVTPFTLACILGNLKAVKYFISENIYPKNAVTCILDTAKAKNRKYLDVVKYLLDTLCPKESPQAEEIKITSLLHILAQWCEDVQFIKYELIEARGFHPNALCDIGSSTYVSPLFSALKAPNIPVAKMLICDYTPTSTKDIENLFHGACLGGSLKLTKLLIEKVPAVLHNKTSRFHVSLFGYLYPIHLAVLSQSLELVKYLVDELDIAANAKNQSHLTPLHLAACKQSRFSRCQADIITYLIFSSGYLSLAAKVSNFYNMEEPNLMPIDIAANKEIRSLLEKYSPNLVAERLLTTYDSITIDWKSPLGNGKFGSVFRGTYRYTPVAVKVITPTPKVPFKSVYLSFMREVGVMGSLRHQNLCLIEAAAIGDGKFILVMELMESSLLKYINDNNVPLPNNQIKKFAIDICRGMLALHTNDPVILHRDLKLANILLNSEGRAKISDFGISRYSFVKGEAEVYKNILPESFDPNKDQFTEQEDIYAFGICLLGMVLSPNDLQETNQRQFYIKRFSNNYCANKELVDIIKKCTEEYRNERYKSFEDVLRDVEQIPTEIPTASEVCGSSISISPPGDDGYVSVDDEILWDIRHGDGDGDGNEDGDGDGGGDENPPSGVYITIGNMCE